MPPHYPLGANDCWDCTVIESIDELMVLKEHYPLKYKKLVKNLQAVYGVIKDDLKRIEKIRTFYEGGNTKEAKRSGGDSL
jgi:hypothetical protein